MSNIYVEMCKSLVCILDPDSVIELLRGEGFTIGEIESFIEECEK